MIRFLGMVDEVTKDQLYAGAVANLVPTRALEGFGLVVVEAAMQGCPTIATEVDGLPEAIASLGEGGKVVAPEVEAMADALRSMPVQHDRASLRARAHAFYGIPPIVP
jgi:glycosyltransferase involved in cell wall biosynthesis